MIKNIFITILLLIIVGLTWLLLSLGAVQPEVLPPETTEPIPSEEGETIITEYTLPVEITSHSWYWTQTEFVGGRIVRPRVPNLFAISFPESGRVAVQTDCNSMIGSYQLGESGTLQFSEFATTLMYCEDSQEQEFAGMLRQVETFELAEEGLRLILADGAGLVEFVVRETE